ncbi:MAG: sodium:solute symporter [Flavobacteriales bacterium]|nr:sodium:solute symporter [Flavobacteriales bacterium]MCB9448946.1 sodium:solute symporter [Flavobacteriales bacterium]
MTSYVLLVAVVLYFCMLVLIARVTGKDEGNQAFFVGNRRSPWFLVAFGMIGASLSGVTFISVPGWVGTSQFSYMQVVLGYLVGYAVIAFVLMPIYYRLNLVSIYTYLQQRFGFWAYKTGALFFLISRLIGASFRLFLVALVLHEVIFTRITSIHIPFPVTVMVTVALIWVYTHRGGIKTIVYTDVIQTLFMLISVGISVYVVSDMFHQHGDSVGQLLSASKYTRWLFLDDPMDGKFFVKQFLGGAFIAIAMTGLDQDMMQKNLSCRNIRDAQKNMMVFSMILVVVNALFLVLGVLLYEYAAVANIPVPDKTDLLFPILAIDYLGPAAAIFFILGLIAAAYSSADSALAALTTSVCVDFLDTEKMDTARQVKVRKRAHIGMSVMLVLVILVFGAMNDRSVIDALFTAAGYTYGPLLGLFALGVLSKAKLRNNWTVVAACIAAPLTGFWLKSKAVEWFGSYQIGYELLVVNALITIVYLLLFSLLPERKQA